MAGKLYWRIKKDGKWTWKPAEVYELWTGMEHTTCVHKLEEEELHHAQCMKELTACLEEEECTRSRNGKPCDAYCPEACRTE